VDIVLIFTVRVARYVCLRRSGQAVPVLGAGFMTPDLGPKKCPHTVGGQLFGSKFGTTFGTTIGGQMWYPKRGPHMVPKNKVSAAVF